MNAHDATGRIKKTQAYRAYYNINRLGNPDGENKGVVKRQTVKAYSHENEIAYYEDGSIWASTNLSDFIYTPAIFRREWRLNWGLQADPDEIDLAIARSLGMVKELA